MKYSLIMALVTCVLAGAPMALAQASTYAPPKTSWGVPDFTGSWSTASLTTMTRPAGASGLVIGEAEAAKLFNKNIYTRVAKEESVLSKAELLTDANPDRAYNRFWMDPGADLGKIDGKYRSSWIIEPANGQIPYISPPKRPAGNIASEEEQYADLGSDNPEDRGLSERCLFSASTNGPVISNTMYNNNIQIVQSPEHVMILGEMSHEVRIISLTGRRNPASMPKWGGDSIGHYEGNSLVVETVNVMPRQNSFISDKGKVTERFTRNSDGQIIYRFTVEDPTKYTQLWTGEMPMNPSQGVYEYACHEGNYSMFNLLSGARAFEREGRTNGMRKAIFAGVAEVE